MAAQSFSRSSIKNFLKYPNAVAGNAAFNKGWVTSHSYVVNGYGNTAVQIDPASQGSVNYSGILNNLVKFNGVGSGPLWQKTLTSTYPVGISAIAIDSGSNVIVGGLKYSSGITKDGFVAKYNSSGSLQWQRNIADNSGNSSSDAQVMDVLVDSSSNVYVIGRYQISSGGAGQYLLKYNSSGVLQWQRTLATGISSQQAIPNGAAIDGSGNIYTCGQVTISGSGYGYIVKYDSSGTLQWQKAAGTGTYYGIALDTSGNPHVTGSCSNGIVLAKYDSSGTLQWSKAPSGLSGSFARGITLDSSNNIYLAGYYYSAAQLGCLIKTDSTGTTVWTRKLRDNMQDYGGGYCVPDKIVYSSANDAVFVRGRYQFRNLGGSSTPSESFSMQYPTDGTRGGKYYFNVSGISVFLSSLGVVPYIDITSDNIPLYSFTLTQPAPSMVSGSNPITETAGSLTSTDTSVSNMRTVGLINVL